MAADIVPELYTKIETEFNSKIGLDRSIQNIMKRIENGTATLEDVHKYTERIGEALSGVLLSNLSTDNLPDNTLYWNIAERTVKPMLETSHRLANDTASAVQKLIDEAEGIGLNALISEFPEYRVRDLIDKAVTSNNPVKWFGEPVINTTESFFDDFVRTNADFRYKAGMSPKIIRTLGSSGQRKSRNGQKYSVPCDWCVGLAGVYEYHSEPRDVYRRHEGCRCVVTFQNGKNRQNVWNKNIWQSDEETLNKRRTAGITTDSISPDVRTRRAVVAENVTTEYIRNATPGVGSVTKEAGYETESHSEEIKVAQWLVNKFGGNILLLNEDNTSKMPDYLWNSKLWDLKRATAKTVDSRVRKGLKQIVKNPGGLIIDFKDNVISLQEIESIIKSRIERRLNRASTDVIIIRNNELVKVLRYKD